MQSRGTRRRAGFTLIELLVVIAIIAILASILFPVFAKAREKANQNSCLNNQRQIAIAVSMYVQDHDEKFFPNPGRNSWAGVLKAYNEPSIYDCPSVRNKGTNDHPEYGVNRWLCNLALGEITSPETTLLTADLDPVSDSYTKGNGMLNDFNADIATRHSNGTILSCVDGHVKYENITEAPGDALGKIGYQMMIISDTYLYKTYDTELASATPAGQMKVNGNGDNKWRCSATVLTLPEGCYRVNASDPIPDMMIEYEVTFNTLSGGGAEYSKSALGLFMDDAETVAGTDFTDVFSGLISGVWRYGAIPGDGWSNLGNATSNRFITVATTLNTFNHNDPAMYAGKAPMYGNQWYRARLLFKPETVTVVTLAYSGDTFLGQYEAPFNPAGDMAPGLKKMAAYCCTRNVNGFTAIRNIKIYKF